MVGKKLSRFGVGLSCAFFLFVPHGRAQMAAPNAVGPADGWVYDSNDPTRVVSADAIGIKDVITNAVDAWNRKNLYGYFEMFLRSDALLIRVDGEEMSGWNAVWENYSHYLGQPSAMGHSIEERLKIRLLSPGVGYVLGWWRFESALVAGHGEDAAVFLKTPDGWKLAAAHTKFERQ
jgi:hypothetical protein